jgi:hypothetical protein
LRKELASTKTMKFVRLLSEIARSGPAIVEVNKSAGNRTAYARLESTGIRRSHPAATRVRRRLAATQ